MADIVPAREDMLDEIEAIERLCFSQPWTLSVLRSQLDAESHIFLAALHDGAVAGYAGAQTVLDECYISNIAVAPRFRRQGLAEALVREMERECRARGMAFMTLEVRAGNAPAIALYEKCGFLRCGVRAAYYFDPREDAVIMTRFFNSQAEKD
ncbi:MAG: ribosomal protein S18-alanine N-acetyltransferase [Oscillospiraceae bacterium]|nr:ribosomal protein S18-alanine N-acetyltransferase [Oscillospiraceae bacterium]